MLAERACVFHPDRGAKAACQRCGRLLCDEDRRVVDEMVHCPRCDPLESFRAKLWGKRDVWAWLMGLSAPPQLWMTVDAVRTGAGLPWVVANAALTVLCACYFFGQRWTRTAVLLSPLAVLAAPDALFLSRAPRGMELGGVVWATKLTVLLVGTGLLVGMYLNVRNQLFFRIDPPRARLAEERTEYFSNRIARWALGISLGGLILPGLGAAALPMAITALYRIRTHPEAGLPGKHEAAWSIALALVSGALFVLLQTALNTMNERILRGEPPF